MSLAFIYIVSFFSILAIVASTLVGYLLGAYNGHEIFPLLFFPVPNDGGWDRVTTIIGGLLGGSVGFTIGIVATGFWCLLASIHQRLYALTDLADEIKETSKVKRTVDDPPILNETQK